MMIAIACVLLAFASSTAKAFVVGPKRRCTEPVSVLRMGMFDDMFKSGKNQKKKSSSSWIDQVLNGPMQGKGSGGKNLDDIYEAQLELLKSRREHFSKEALRNKYKTKPAPEDLPQDIKMKSQSPAYSNKKEDDAMYVADDGGFQMPWDKKKKSKS